MGIFCRYFVSDDFYCSRVHIILSVVMVIKTIAIDRPNKPDHRHASLIDYSIKGNSLRVYFKLQHLFQGLERGKAR